MARRAVASSMSNFEKKMIKSDDDGGPEDDVALWSISNESTRLNYKKKEFPRCAQLELFIFAPPY